MVPSGDKDYTPKKAVEKQLARRKVILDCIRVSITTNDEILATLHARGYPVSERTMIEDKMAVMASIKDYYGRDAQELTAEIVAQQDGVIYQLQQIASNKEADHNVKVSALAKKNDVLTGKAKLLGLIKDKQEITGSVTNVNLNREVSKDEAREFVKALKDVDLDVEDAA